MTEELVPLELVIPASAGPFETDKFVKCGSCYAHNALMKRLPNLDRADVQFGSLAVNIGDGEYKIDNGSWHQIKASLDAGRDHIVTVWLPKHVLLAGK